MERAKNRLSTIGIEDEMFVTGPAAKLTGEAQRELLSNLASRFKYRITATSLVDGLPLQLNKDFDGGYSCIKFDSTFNIIEVAHPPEASVERLVDHVAEVRSQLEVLSADFGLRINCTGHLPANLNRESFLPKETIVKTLERPESRKPLFDRYYHGKICSTQIHLALENKTAFKNLSKYYQLEPLIPLLFSNSSIAGVAHSFRSLLIQDAFRSDYVFFGFPNAIYDSEARYQAAIRSANGYFRDYSLIVPRDIGTWEFRSADCQRDAGKICALLYFRVATSRLIEEGQWRGVEGRPDYFRDVFLTGCRSAEDLVVRDYLAHLGESGFFSLIIDKKYGSNSIEALLKERNILSAA